MNGVWIRSQDKKILTNVCQVFVSANGTVRTIVAGGYDSDTIGMYSTQERALQVLDEIQRYIRDIEITKLGAMNAYDAVYTFEMPAE